MSRRLAAAALVAAAAAAPFSGTASAVCQGASPAKGAVTAGYCDEYADHWNFCAGVSVTGVAGYVVCQPENGAGLWVGCWTFQGLHCN